MGTFIGSDPEELGRVAQAMGNAALALDNRRRQITSAVNTVHWEGDSADRFRTDWNSRLSATIARIADVLTAESAQLKFEAQQQVAASTALTGGGGGVLSPGFDPSALLPGVLAIMLANPFVRPLIMSSIVRAEQGKTPGDQAAWWASLTPDERKAFLATVPLSLLSLAGLPAADRTTANRNAADSLKSSIMSSSVDQNVNASASVKIFSFGGGADVTETKYADGHYEVTLSGSAFAGVGLGVPNAGADVQLNGQASRTYSFDNAAQARAFEQGLFNSLIPMPHFDAKTILLESLPFAGPIVAVAADSASQLGAYLAGYQNDVVHTQFKGELAGDINLSTPGAEGVGNPYGNINLQAGAGLTYDATTHQTAAFVEVDASGQGSFGPFDGTASGQLSASVTFDSNHQLQALTVTGQYSAAGGYDPQFSPVPGMNGSAGSFQVTLDCTNPQNAALASQFVDDLQRKDFSAAASVYLAIQAQSQIVVQTDSVHESQASLNAVVVSGGGSVTTTTGVNTWVQVPGGSFTRVG